MLALSVLDLGLCSLDVTCKQKNSRSSSAKEKEHHCYITEFPLSNTNRETYNFQVDYEQPTDIEQVDFVSTKVKPLIVETFPTEMFTNFPNLHGVSMAQCRVNLEANEAIASGPTLAGAPRQRANRFASLVSSAKR